MSHGIELDLIPESLRPGVLALIQARDAAELENRLLREQLRLALIKKYGPKSESLSDAQLQFLELEPVVEAGEVAAEAARGSDDGDSTQTTKTRKKSDRKSGRNPLPAHLPRTVVTVPVPPEQCVCERCQSPKDLIGFDESEQLHVEPARYSVIVTRREKRACKCCPEQGVQTAPAPERILPKGKLSDALLIEVLVRKFAEHMPVYRQCAGILRDSGVELSRQTLTDGLMVCGNLMTALTGAMKVELFAGGYLQADETTVPVQSAAVRGRNHQGYFWQYGRPNGSVVFDFQMGRSRAGPKEFLEGFAGWVQCDGYSAYKDLGSQIRFAGCLAHARRRFFEAGQLSPKDPAILGILGCFTRIYAIESEAREAGLDPAARRALRQKKSAPLMGALKTQILEVQRGALPASKLGGACTYALNQWDRLTQFLGEGVLEVDNNWCENGMRPIALGRNYAEIRIMRSTGSRSALGPRRTRRQCLVTGVLQLNIIFAPPGTGSAGLSFGARFSRCGAD